jgi:hypothetical protein
LDIFISYRRGGADQANAGRIHDYLQTLGYPSFYDKDEEANPIGGQFPSAITEALRRCKVLIAIIGESWIAQAARLKHADDWVRQELLHASPPTTLLFIPIFFSARPQPLDVALPEALEFVRTANHLAWDGFEDAQKITLRDMLQRALPEIRWGKAIADSDRLELLCDRVRAADGFDDALNRRDDLQRPGCWILFGEQGEGQAAIFDRIEAYTLESAHYKERYPQRQLFNLELDEYRGCPEEEIRARVIRSVAGECGIDSYHGLYCELSRKGIALSVLFSVVHVTDVADAEWWIERFMQLQKEFPPISVPGPQIVLALSISYAEPKPPVLLSFFGRRSRVEQFFRARYPDLFLSEDDVVRSGGKRAATVVRRLKSAMEIDVRHWCENRYVKPRIAEFTRDDFLAQFKTEPLRPMENVMDTLQSVLRASRRTSAPVSGRGGIAQ